MVVPPKPFNFAALEVQVRKAARRAFKEVASAHPEDQLCAFALYSDDGAMTVCPSINTSQHLAAMQRKHPDEAMYYKFATPEWKYEATGAEAAFRAICEQVRTQALAFEGVTEADAKTLAGVSPLRMVPAARGFGTFKRALFETCLRVLETLRRDRLFAGVMLVFAVSDTDSSARRELAMIKRLNDKAVVDEFRSWTKTWGQ
jgi:Domain of unknown function (DUF4303)